MAIDERIQKALSDFAAVTKDNDELVRLQEFYQRMKDAGLVKAREYDLPQPDTLGRATFIRSKQPSNVH